MVNQRSWPPTRWSFAGVFLYCFLYVDFALSNFFFVFFFICYFHFFQFLRTGTASETRTLTRDLMTTRTYLRQKDTELEELRQANRDLTHDVEDLRRTQSETEDSCNEIVQKTNETAEEDRLTVKKLR